MQMDKVTFDLKLTKKELYDNLNFVYLLMKYFINMSRYISNDMCNEVIEYNLDENAKTNTYIHIIHVLSTSLKCSDTIIYMNISITMMK